MLQESVTTNRRLRGTTSASSSARVPSHPDACSAVLVTRWARRGARSSAARSTTTAAPPRRLPHSLRPAPRPARSPSVSQVRMYLTADYSTVRQHSFVLSFKG